MAQVKELNITNQTYYFSDDMIDIRNFNSNLLKIGKKSQKDIDIYVTLRLRSLVIVKIFAV